MPKENYQIFQNIVKNLPKKQSRTAESLKPDDCFLNRIVGSNPVKKG